MLVAILGTPGVGARPCPTAKGSPTHPQEGGALAPPWPEVRPWHGYACSAPRWPVASSVLSDEATEFVHKVDPASTMRRAGRVSLGLVAGARGTGGGLCRCYRCYR